MPLLMLADRGEVWKCWIGKETCCGNMIFLRSRNVSTMILNTYLMAMCWLLLGRAKTQAEADQAGRTNANGMVWAEKIVEIQPDFVNGGGTVVWEWHVWDHLVQEVDNTKDNFGVVANSPELVNINYNPTNGPDWLHINGVDYNAELDQIVLSVFTFGEIWIIDHSTTTAEAAGHTGGNTGKGGDLLYRWGNPQAYQQGNANNQQLFRQHHANWITDGLPDEGMIMVFNNRAGTPMAINYSAVNIIDPTYRC